MKFETINNQLCRIVEPEPLTEESKFPCVVRLIQDDSPMGRNNDFYATSHLLAHIEIINCLDATHFVRWQGSKTYYSRFEIIGYPVVDGSHWWALYQMMQGKKVCNPTLAAEKATRLGSYEVEQFNTFWYIVGDAVAEGKSNYGTLSVSSWIAASSSTGWQIYEEPKPKPKPALKVGDWAKYDIDSYLRVIETPGRERTLCKTLSGVIVYPYTSCLTKVSPSEVVVHIGCLSGPVRRSSSSHFCIICGDHWSMIAFAMLLDTATRELVKALLEAQEEK